MSSSEKPIRNVSQLAGQEFDVLIIGGGIVGAGVARDAALRGLRVALVEQNDFASGTSSRSSRLLHGGLRYLAQGHVRLVREASHEKHILQKIAPHLAEPLAFLFPTYRGTPWKKWKLRIGVKLYDWLCGGKNFGKSSTLNQDAVLKLLPKLNQPKLTGAVRYFDGLTNDARLVLDTLRSAENASAMVCNYVKFENANDHSDHWKCDLVDVHQKLNLTVQTKTIVNATGPWSDQIPRSNTNLRLTKGVHLVIPRDRLPVPDAVVMSRGKRILFAIPWAERVILGTTDTDYQGLIDRPTCDAADVEYVLDVVNQYFPEAELRSDDLISTWAGLRPLVYDKRGGPSDTSREHEITSSQPGWWDITGGKLTTYRLMGQQTVDRICDFLENEKTTSTTADVPLLSPAELQGNSSLTPPAINREIVEHYCLKQWAIHLSDIMIRRTSWCYYFKNHEQIALEVAQWMAEVLGWNLPQKEQQIAEYIHSINEANPWRQH